VNVILVLIRSGHQPERIETDMNVIPGIHEMISIGGMLYRVEDITHNIETKQVEVRAVA
jgi:hypothetical protein